MAYSVKDFIRNPMSLKASVVWNVLWVALLMVIEFALLEQLVTPANAHVGFTNCSSIEQLVANLRNSYGQTIQMVLPNLQQPNVNGQTILTANVETGTWTILVIGPDFPDLMCIVQGGEGYDPDLFQIVPPDEDFKAEVEGDPT